MSASLRTGLSKDAPTVAASWFDRLTTSDRCAARSSRNEDCMTLDYAIGLLVTAALLVYLTYALLRPEKF